MELFTQAHKECLIIAGNVQIFLTEIKSKRLY